MRIIRKNAYARAGLIGNPTDGYGGKTVSFTMRELFAYVVMYPWERLEILWSQEDRNRFDSIDELVDDVSQHGYYGGVRLVKATIKRFAEYCRANDIELHAQPFSVRYETNIPRGVGLAGSSAIVTATLKCLLEFYEVSIPLVVQPSLVRSVENDELGIACGYQDRVAQVYGGLMYMDFSAMREIDGYSCGHYERLDASLLPPVYIVYDSSAAKESDSVHGPLRTRYAGDAELARTMSEIAGLVPAARRALERRDIETLNRLINHNFDLRARMYNIRPAHQLMIDAARDVGASAKFAGSGGAIVGTYEDEPMFAALCSAMTAANRNWVVLQPDV